MRPAYPPIASALDTAADELKLTKIPDSVKLSSLKLSTRRGTDLFLMLLHPDWSDWRPHMPAVAQIILSAFQNSNSDAPLHIRRCEAVSNPPHSIAISFDRSKTVPQILLQHGDRIQAAKSACISPGAERMTVASVKTPDRGWTCRRIDIFTATIRHAIGLTRSKTPDLVEIVSGIGVEESSENAAEFETIKKQLPAHFDSETGDVIIDASFLRNQDPQSCSFALHPQSNVIPAIVRLRKSLPTNTQDRLILVVHHSLVTAYRRAIVVLSLTSCSASLATNCTIIPVQQVNCDQDPNEFTDWLKNMIVAQSVSDWSEESGMIGDSPAVPMDTVLKLFQTCIQFTLLSKPPHERLSIDHSVIRSYLFVQYNISRLNSLIAQFDSHQPHDSACKADLSLLTSDLEWDLVFKHVQQFDGLLKTRHDAEVAFHLLISYMGSLCKDLSEYCDE